MAQKEINQTIEIQGIPMTLKWVSTLTKKAFLKNYGKTFKDAKGNKTEKQAIVAYEELQSKLRNSKPVLK